MRGLRPPGGGGGERGGGAWGGEATIAAGVPARRPGVPVHGPRAPSCCRQRSYLCEVRVAASVRAGVATQGSPEQPGRCSPRTVPTSGCTASPDHRRRARPSPGRRPPVSFLQGEKCAWGRFPGSSSMCRSTVSSNKVSPFCLFLFCSALALRWDRAR